MRRCSAAANSPCHIYPSYRQFQPTPSSVHRVDTKASVFREGTWVPVFQFSIVPSLYQCCKLWMFSGSALYRSVFVYKVFTILLLNRHSSLSGHNLGKHAEHLLGTVWGCGYHSTFSVEHLLLALSKKSRGSLIFFITTDPGEIVPVLFHIPDGEKGGLTPPPPPPRDMWPII